MMMVYRIGIYDPTGSLASGLLSKNPAQFIRQAGSVVGEPPYSRTGGDSTDEVENWSRDKQSFFQGIDAFVGVANGFEGISFMMTAIRTLLGDRLRYVYVIGPENTLEMLTAASEPKEQDRLASLIEHGRLQIFREGEALLRAIAITPH